MPVGSGRWAWADSVRAVPALASNADVVAVAELAGRAGRMGVDTEFMTEGRYTPLLCLVQVAVPDADGSVRIELLDPLSSVDPSPLARVVADPTVEVIVHAARQDVALLRRVWETEVTALFDTQVAAGFAGAPAQSGYANLLSSFLKVELPKTASYTRWDARPLSAEQLAYARADVEHLLQLADVIHERLDSTGRAEWAREECRPLEASSDVRDPATAYKRLGKVNQLSPQARAVARELAAWREETARQEDRPLGQVLPDPAIVEAARRQPRDLGALEQIRGIHPGTLRRRGRDVLDAIARGRDADPVPAEGERVSGDARDAPLVALAEALVRSRTLETSLAYELVASRSDLGAIVRAVRRREPEPSVRTLEGWRRELVGAELLDLLAGRHTLAVGGGGRLEMTLRGAAGG